ncbi:MAG: hypothetical protein JXQ96_21935 [Cyclobacteriaceae bacterium]
MSPFFMSIVSDSDHWMFISSNGGLTAGRKDADHALFPYYTDDKITETSELTGSKSIFRVEKAGVTHVWEPFSVRTETQFEYSRNLYKNLLGNKILFEEVNHDLGITFRYQWSSSDQFGYVRSSSLINNSPESVSIHLLDGIQNIMPYGVTSDTQFIRSNLVDAYKKSELELPAGLGIYALSSIIVDRAEPSEALKANIAWSCGIDDPTYLMSSAQLDAFRKGEALDQEIDIKAQKGAYFVVSHMSLAAESKKNWHVIANVNQGPSEVADIVEAIEASGDALLDEVLMDVESGSKQLEELIHSSDGFQLTDDKKRDTRHYSNVLFNIMRGGIFDHNYNVERWDFIIYVQKANAELFSNFSEQINSLPENISIQALKDWSVEIGNQDLIRLTTEYLPLKFSRRHGDPSRPWNRFSINTRSEEDGSKVLDYEGNWRDIFQNWEALSHSFPDFIEGMIFKFLNASTFDGYNPYRVTKDGFDWEVIEEHDPWSYIGYWGDHQIIYLLKFLEFIEGHNPGKLADLFNQELFVFANVPYRIKSYADLLANPKDTIEFDDVGDRNICARRNEIGADGALLQNADGSICKVNFLEKILVTALAKLSNFIPEGGIWMNTQRPEWNDANNALVGNGVSMVTLYYLRRFFKFFDQILESGATWQELQITEELHEFYSAIRNTLTQKQNLLSGDIDDQQRKQVLDGLGMAGSNYRDKIYGNQHSGNKMPLGHTDLKEFAELVLKYLDHSIAANKRADKMYHAYNLMTVKGDDKVSISYLDEMLEGQVAALSSGSLSAKQCMDLLDGLKSSALFRPDQYSYILYPNKDLGRFVEKNVIPAELVDSSALLKQLVNDGNIKIVEKDVKGKYHFNGKFTNAEALKIGLSNLKEYDDLLEAETENVLQIFEDVFNHKAFTGRSGTFFGYEGLGSIYWHMVSKLSLAVHECCIIAIKKGQDEGTVGRLLEHYYEINEGIGVHKSPELYGAFPTDPYSHTPYGKGVQQPGMTGQVKEDILARIGELGVFVNNGQLKFNPCLLKKDEFLKQKKEYKYVDVNQQNKIILLVENTLAFSYCQVPIIYRISESDGIVVNYTDGNSKSFHGLHLDQETSQKVFSRNGSVDFISVAMRSDHLK